MNTGPGTLRVKVYKLNDEGTWDDNGTGQATVEYYEVSTLHVKIYTNTLLVEGPAE